jgi:hypothetical protein
MNAFGENMMDEQQRLLAEVLDLFAQRFDRRAVLRGGMVLRILGCERLTNDLDYVFVPYRSKKDVVDDVLLALRTLPGVKVSHALNSKCLRVTVEPRLRGNPGGGQDGAAGGRPDVVPPAVWRARSTWPPRLIRVVGLSGGAGRQDGGLE